MAITIRNLSVEEFDRFMRYLERAFGHSRGWFKRHLPHLYQPTEEACNWAYVLVEDGKILSHVGLYPIESVTADLPLSIGGIGAVSTAVEARGKGYMTRLLNHVIDEMRRIGYPVSWLGGDRQRYNAFGWENADCLYELSFTKRSMSRNPVGSVEIEEVYPAEALETINRYYTLHACHTRRPNLETQVQKQDLRFWIAEDGYAIVQGQERDRLRIVELVSASKRETNMIQALMNWNFSSKATWTLSKWDQGRLGRVMPFVSQWCDGYSGMYRINDLTGLLLSVKPYLEHRAAAITDFSATLGIRERDRTDYATLTVEGGKVNVSSSQGRQAIILSPISAARLFIGGPTVPEASEIPDGLKALLPVPVTVLPLDYV